MKTIQAICLMLLIHSPIHAEDVMVVAHRGASKQAPENTIPAFKLAWERGADAIEGDFHLTKDGVIVCCHDGKTDRVAGKNLVIRESTLAELRKLDVGGRFGEAFKGAVIPTLAEVLAVVPQGKKLFIEVKCGTEIVPALIAEIGKSGLGNEQVVVISFDAGVIRELKTQAPQYKAYWLCSFKQGKNGTTTPSLESVLDTLKSCRADGLSSNTVVPESYIEAVRTNGCEWHVWTVDDAEAARRLVKMGVRSITTNMPDMIQKSLGEASPSGGDTKSVSEK